MIQNVNHQEPLTHWGRVTHICVSKPTTICSNKWLVAWPAPSHNLNECWNIVNWTIGNKPQWNLKRNSYIFTEENALENVVWKMVAILSRPQCVDTINVLRFRIGCNQLEYMIYYLLFIVLFCIVNTLLYFSVYSTSLMMLWCTSIINLTLKTLNWQPSAFSSPLLLWWNYVSGKFSWGGRWPSFPT